MCFVTEAGLYDILKPIAIPRRCSLTSFVTSEGLFLAQVRAPLP